MKIYYNNTRIVKPILDINIDISSIPPNCESIEIDEIDENDLLIKDIINMFLKMDITGLSKYYIFEGEIYEREGWELYTPDLTGGQY